MPKDRLPLLFRGGEPTLAGEDYFQHFHEAVQRYNIHRLPVSVSLQTNGLSLSDRLMELFAAHHYLLGVSVDGDAALHDSLRPDTFGKGTFARINDPTEMTNLSGRPEYAEVERKFLMDVVDFMCLSKGVRIEAHDLVPKAKAGLKENHPKFWDDFEIAYPLGSWGLVKRVKDAGLDYNYNEFCRDREIKAHYGVYFHKEKAENF